MSPLRAKREQAGLTVTALAARAGMLPSKLSRLERGLLKLKVDDLLVLAEVLECDVPDLIPAGEPRVPAALTRQE
jgi:transcriptional regulator with XRE-family HTH domain